MQRRAELMGGRGRLGGGNIVDLTIGNHDDRGEALPRHIGHRPTQRGKQFGAVVAAARLRLAGADHPHIEVALALQPLGQRRQRRFSGLLPVADLLARRLVDDDDRDIAQGRALFLDERRVDENRQQHRHRRPPPCDAARAAPDARREHQRGRAAEHRDQPPRQQRRGRQRVGAAAERGDHIGRALIGRAAPGSPARAPDRSCSCRSART